MVACPTPILPWPHPHPPAAHPHPSVPHLPLGVPPIAGEHLYKVSLLLIEPLTRSVAAGEEADEGRVDTAGCLGVVWGWGWGCVKLVGVGWVYEFCPHNLAFSAMSRSCSLSTSPSAPESSSSRKAC